MAANPDSLPPSLEHFECDHERGLCMVEIPGMGLDGAFVDVSGNRTLAQDLHLLEALALTVEGGLRRLGRKHNLTRVEQDSIHVVVGYVAGVVSDIQRQANLAERAGR